MLFEQIKKLLPKIEFWALIVFFMTFPFSKALGNISIAVIAIGWALECILARRILFPKTSFNILILVFFLSLSLSFFETHYFSQSIRGVSKLLQRFGFFFLTIHVLNSCGKIELFLKWLLAGFTVIILNGFFQLAFGHDLLRGRVIRYANNFPRITSSFEFPDQYALFLIYAIFIFSFFIHTAKTLVMRSLGALLTAGGLFSLFLTQARGAWLGLVVALIFSCLFLKRALLVLMSIGALLTFLLLLSPSDILIHKDAEGKEQSVSERFTLWNRALNMIKAHPITGVGINTYGRETDNYMTDTKKNLSGYYAHNGLLQMTAESGIPTVCLYLIFLVSVFVAAFRALGAGSLSINESALLKAILAGTVGFFILNLFDSLLFSVQPAQLYYFFLGVICYLIGKKGETPSAS